MSEKLKQKLSPKVNSDVILNLKDIEKLRSVNMVTKQDDKLKTMDDTLEKYNKNYRDAKNAPIPNIKLHFTEVLVRAVPVEMRSKGGIILHTGMTDAGVISKLDYLSEAVADEQEILMLGDMLEERNAKIKPGDMAKISFNRFRQLDDTGNGVIKTSYQVPVHTIDGYKYMIIDHRDIVYTTEA